MNTLLKVIGSMFLLLIILLFIISLAIVLYATIVTLKDGVGDLTRKKLAEKKKTESDVIQLKTPEFDDITYIVTMDDITKVEEVLKRGNTVIKITFINGNNLQLDFGSNVRERRVIFDALKYIKK